MIDLDTVTRLITIVALAGATFATLWWSTQTDPPWATRYLAAAVVLAEWLAFYTYTAVAMPTEISLGLAGWTRAVAVQIAVIFMADVWIRHREHQSVKNELSTADLT